MKSGILILILVIGQTLNGQQPKTTDAQAKAIIESFSQAYSPFVTRSPAMSNLQDDSLSINRYMELLAWGHIPFSDTTVVVELIQKLRNQRTDSWTQDLMTNKVLIDSGEVLDAKKLIPHLKPTKGKNYRILKKRIRKFNARYRISFRTYPVAFSWPVISDNKKYALMTINLGNNGWFALVLRKLDDGWEYYKDFMGGVDLKDSTPSNTW